MKLNSMLRFLGAFGLAVGMASHAEAGRETVTCKEAKKRTSGYDVSLTFDSTISRETNWQKDAKGNDVIITYKNGTSETATETTARVTMKIARTEFKKPYSGTFKWSDFYDVNTKDEAGSGYSDRFGGSAYRSFHGHDENDRWDAMVYIPDTGVRESAKTFPGLLTIQMDLMDQGYYHIDLTCSSKPAR